MREAPPHPPENPLTHQRPGSPSPPGEHPNRQQQHNRSAPTTERTSNLPKQTRHNTLPIIPEFDREEGELSPEPTDFVSATIWDTLCDLTTDDEAKPDDHHPLVFPTANLRSRCLRRKRSRRSLIKATRPGSRTSSAKAPQNPPNSLS
ncbi:uncharacterized protein M6B38_257280 [Iris pallida]|uniref:Uncharacterized protein n=1 Tax=Iris pallida TaxID=29817 RepID=A0AAX6IFJ8_IRIPA|nr:uncharacterized protein M6B38_257280 [Iris pallida]